MGQNIGNLELSNLDRSSYRLALFVLYLMKSIPIDCSQIHVQSSSFTELRVRN